LFWYFFFIYLFVLYCLRVGYVLERLKIEIVQVWKANGIEKYCYSPLNIGITELSQIIKKRKEEPTAKESVSVSIYSSSSLPPVPGVPVVQPVAHSSLSPLLNIGFSRIVLGMVWYVLHIATHNNYAFVAEAGTGETTGDSLRF
jgi:hypothetical protein